MKVLGIESSGSTASVALIEDDHLIAEYTICHTMKHSKTLMPMLEDMMNRLETDINTVDLISVSEGPGSFTGLRIGSATAKGIAHGLNIKIASIRTLEVIASQIQIPDARIGVIVFARAREVYYATYTIKFKDGQFYPVEDKAIVALELEELLEQLKTIDETFYIVGDGITKFKSEFKDINPNILVPAPMFCSNSAKNVAFLGLRRYYDNDVMTYYEQKPYYYKKSQAEREYEEKHK